MRILSGVLAAALGATSVQVAAGEGFKPKYKSSSGGFEIALKGYVQGDFRSFSAWEVQEDAAEGDFRYEEAELRRARFGIEGQWNRLSFEATVDVMEDSADAQYLKDAYLDFKVSKGLRVRAGHFKLPISPEYLTSYGKSDFMERTMLATALAPSRDLGVMLHGDFGQRVAYQAGVFAGDGRTEDSRAGTTGAARLVVTPAKGLDLGASGSIGSVEADPTTSVEPVPKGFEARGPSGYKYFGAKFVDGERVRAGLDAAYQSGPLVFKAELLHGREQRHGQGSTGDDLPDVVATGWAVSGTWLVTGETKKSSGVQPRKGLLAGGPGAIEIGVRYESLDLDDNGPDQGFAGSGNRARNIVPAGDRVFTGGVSWWPSDWFRVMGNVLVEKFKDPLLAPEPGKQGNYVTLVGRLQFHIP
jgi:phosphate-selective porin OprO/OprP